MSAYTEKEIKILDVDVEDIKVKLETLGAIKDFECVQDIATYQFPTTETRYKNLLNQLGEDKVDKDALKQKFIKFFEEMNNVVNGDDLTALCGKADLIEFSQNFSLKDAVLTDNSFIEYIGKLNNRFFKWIRLRTTNGSTTLTIKEIFSQEDEYPIDKLKEVEFEVGDFDAADKFLQELDFTSDSHQEKRRAQYKYKGMEIVIDTWPLIPPYVEIEGDNPQQIYELVNKLGYKNEDAVVMNTDTVYQKYGYNREEYLQLTFAKQIKRK